jgi:GMP synthase-like glutamine amidotransferase
MSDTTTTGPDWRALVIQHERPTPPGLIEPWLRDRGAQVEVLRIDEEDPHDLDPQDYGLIVSLGSEFGAYEDSIKWISHEIDLLQAATKADVPILGVCFGGHLLARTLGGEVFRSEQEEIGWLPVETHDADLVPGGPWFQWHFDTFTVPPGARVLAETNVGPQAFSIGRSLGVQFHPEVTPEIMDAWVLAYRHELDEHGVDPDRLLEETHERSESARTTSVNLFDRFLERVARPRERA